MHRLAVLPGFGILFQVADGDDGPAKRSEPVASHLLEPIQNGIQNALGHRDTANEIPSHMYIRTDHNNNRARPYRSGPFPHREARGALVAYREGPRDGRGRRGVTAIQLELAAGSDFPAWIFLFVSAPSDVRAGARRKRKRRGKGNGVEMPSPRANTHDVEIRGMMSEQRCVE